MMMMMMMMSKYVIKIPSGKISQELSDAFLTKRNRHITVNGSCVRAIQMKKSQRWRSDT